MRNEKYFLGKFFFSNVCWGNVDKNIEMKLSYFIYLFIFLQSHENENCDVIWRHDITDCFHSNCDFLHPIVECEYTDTPVMVFVKKKLRSNIETQFKKGYTHPMKGHTLQRCNKVDLNPLMRLSAEKTEMLLQQPDTIKVRLLRPKATEGLEVEKCAKIHTHNGFVFFFFFS